MALRTSQEKKPVVIIGAGPAGLTAAYELLNYPEFHPIVLEEDPRYVGGIAKTIEYKGNRMDIGGHRFFSKSDRVMEWWLSILPLARHTATSLAYQGRSTALGEEGMVDPDTVDEVMLVRKRGSHLYYRRKFFDYPITLSWATLRNLGCIKLVKIAVTYIARRVSPRSPEKSLEDFYINRFGDELYKTFFKSYTAKVWGVPCNQISPEWGAQRVKGISLSKVLLNALQKPFRRSSLAQKDTETSLIEWFLYPKFGPGFLWEVVAKRVNARGGEVRQGERVVRVIREKGRVTLVVTNDEQGREHTYPADYVISTMPVRDLGIALGIEDGAVRAITDELPYRDFMTVGLLLRKGANRIAALSDTWLYIHEPEVDVGRIQIFNNWSPYMVADPEQTVWIGLEYFGNEGDALWTLTDEAFIEKAGRELEAIGLAKTKDILDGVVVRQKKAYTSYTGSYAQFDDVRAFLDAIPNLFLVGRNGMHRYNNQDHSMLVAMEAVKNIVSNRMDKENLWAVNTEEEYHEKK